MYGKITPITASAKRNNCCSWTSSKNVILNTKPLFSYRASQQQEKLNLQIKSSNTQSGCDHHRLQDRQYMSKHYLRHGHPIYAFKTLSKYS